jgi:hypothetical protein
MYGKIILKLIFEKNVGFGRDLSVSRRAGQTY